MENNVATNAGVHPGTSGWFIIHGNHLLRPMCSQFITQLRASDEFSLCKQTPRLVSSSFLSIFPPLPLLCRLNTCQRVQNATDESSLERSGGWRVDNTALMKNKSLLNPIWEEPQPNVRRSFVTANLPLAFHRLVLIPTCARLFTSNSSTV